MHDLTRGEVRSATIVCRDIGMKEEKLGKQSRDDQTHFIKHQGDDETGSDKVGEETFHRFQIIINLLDVYLTLLLDR